MLSLAVSICVKQKTAYEMRISDWSSDVCSSDLCPLQNAQAATSPRKSLTSSSASSKRESRHGRGPGGRTGQGGGLCVSAERRIRASIHSICGSSEERRVGKESVSTVSSRW